MTFLVFTEKTNTADVLESKNSNCINNFRNWQKIQEILPHDRYYVRKNAAISNSYAMNRKATLYWSSI